MGSIILRRVIFIFLTIFAVGILFFELKGPKKNHRIIGLLAVRNESIIIGQCLKALSLYTDGIVVLDDASTDNTVEIIEACAKECRIEKIIRKKTWFRDEPGDRNLLLKEGRKLGGTHFIIIDADEVFTANCLKKNFLRNQILKLQPGDELLLNWIQLWRSVQHYRYDSSVLTNNYKGVIFCDDGKAKYDSDFIHTSRVPNLYGKKYIIKGYSYGLLHFQFVSWNNLLVKQAWYRCLEHIRDPEKSIDNINSMYGQSKDETDLHLEKSHQDWFDGYLFFDEGIYCKPEQWRKKQVLEWFDEYSKDFFKALDIWDIKWNHKLKKPRVSIITSVFNGDRFIRGFLEDMVRQSLFNESELILINANSPGNEISIIKQYLKKHQNIKYIKLDKDPGVYGVWNIGLKMASADLVANANLDDRRNPLSLEMQVEALETDPTIDLVYGSYLITRTPHETYEYNNHQWIVEAIDFEPYEMAKCLPGPQPVWRKSMHTRYGFFKEDFFSSGDWEMWLRAVSKGSRFKKIDGLITGLYYENPHGISTDKDIQKTKRRDAENKLIIKTYSYLWS